MRLPSTRLCASVPKNEAASGSSTFWVEIRQFLRGQPLPTPLYVSPRRTAPDMNPLSVPPDDAGAYQVALTYNPTVVNGTCEVCATITSLANCGW